MKKTNENVFNDMDVRKIAEIRSAVEMATSMIGFELNSNEERLLLFVWLRNNIEEALASEDAQVLEMYSNYIENEIKRGVISTRTNRERMA